MQQADGGGPCDMRQPQHRSRYAISPPALLTLPHLPSHPPAGTWWLCTLPTATCTARARSSASMPTEQWLALHKRLVASSWSGA